MTVPSERSRVSIVVESKNEPHFDDRIPLVESLRAQTYPLAQVELIVAGNAGALKRMRSW